jgi:hypothetical protein
MAELTMQLARPGLAKDNRQAQTSDSDTGTANSSQQATDEEPQLAPVRRRPQRRSPPAPVDPGRIREIAGAMPGEDPSGYRAAIIELILQAKESGLQLKSLQLGKDLKGRFGEQSYRQFRGGKAQFRAAVERLGFCTKPGPGWFTIELP